MGSSNQCANAPGGKMPGAPKEETQAPRQAQAKKGKPAGRGEFCVYLGPSIRGAVASGTVYPSGREATLKELSGVADRFPLVASLVVSGKDLPAARLKVKKPGELLHFNYSKLAGQLKTM